MKVFGDGKGGSISSDSSKKSGRGTGCRVILGSVVFASGFSMVMELRCVGLSCPFTSSSECGVWGVSASWLGVGTSLIPLGPALFFLFFLSSFAITAGPQVAEALAAAVDLVETSLLAGVASIWGGGSWVRFWGIVLGAVLGMGLFFF